MSHFFFDTISALRTAEEMIIYDKILDFDLEDQRLVMEFLTMEYRTEVLTMPFDVPEFDVDAALWAAKTVYTACQILLYRVNPDSELPELLPRFDKVKDASSILSADLCLRFLPQIYIESKAIDYEDKMVPLLEQILQEWHYSSVGTDIAHGDLDFAPIIENACLEQMYLDRVIDRKDIRRGTLPTLRAKIEAILGNHSEYFWREFLDAKNT